VDGSFVCQVKRYEVEHVDEKAFSKSPYICRACYSRVGSPLLNVKCDICKRQSTTTIPKYTVTNRNGVIYIGSQVSLIFDGDIETGHACSTCYLRNRAATLKQQQEVESPTLGVDCDVCGRQNLTFPKYNVTNRNGVIHIGPHISLIFQGDVESGHACNACYSKNKAAIASQQGDLADTIRETSKRRRQPDYENEPETESDDGDEGEDGDVYSNTTTDSRPPKRLALITTNSTLGVKEQTSSSTSDVAKVIETLFSIERAKTETLSIREKIVAFLSLRESMREAMDVVEQSAFNVEEFVALQEYFMAMLDNQLLTIEDDRRHYTAQLTTIGK
jgi:hypothetical protein